MLFRRGALLTSGLLLILATPARGQQSQPDPLPLPSPLDLGRDLKPLVHTPLSEEYIWTANDITAQRPDRSKFVWSRTSLRTAPHLFRRSFHLDSSPSAATLYIAGPRETSVFLNGHKLAHFASDPDAPINFRVFHVNAASLLHAGQNTLAISAIRGRGVVSVSDSTALQQLAYGEVLAVKLVGARFGAQEPVLLRSDKQWRSSSASGNSNDNASPTWSNPSFDDSTWPLVSSLGPVESDRNLLQWSADAGMYAWPGYMGMTPPLGTYVVTPAAVTHVFAGQASLQHTDALTSANASAAPFRILTPLSAQTLPDAESPALLLDFGREIAGRLIIASGSNTDAQISVSYGESEIEALATGLTPTQRGGNYLGSNLLDIPANGIARGPKSAFRFVRIRFLRGASESVFKSIRAEAIAYPVQFAGSFQSSDPLLNRIWQVGAYTVHLCMQDDLWDAPKRDRGRWAGDIDVEGRVISTAFGDHALVERTLTALVPPDATHPVNGIPGYSALWITSLASLYAHSGDLDFLRSRHDDLLRVLATMDATLDSNSLFTPGKGQWPFVDWAPGLYGLTPEAIFGTSLQYLRGYHDALTLLDRLGDTSNAARVRTTAARLEQAVHQRLVSAPGTLGRTPQLNALAVQSGVASETNTQQTIWSGSLSHMRQQAPDDPVISPYFNASVIDTMSQLGHPREALDWLRTYWGGMLAEGATSFWESYDLRWPKDTPHLSLQADGTTGYFVSMAHGWSSGPTAWLSENVLGVRDPVDGYRTVTLAPRLLGLDWANGSVPTPHGLITVSLKHDGNTQHLTVDLPAGIERANLSLDPARSSGRIQLDGKPASAPTAITLTSPGHHTVVYSVAP